MTFVTALCACCSHPVLSRMWERCRARLAPWTTWSTLPEVERWVQESSDSPIDDKTRSWRCSC